MSFRSIVRDVKDGFGSLSQRRFETRLLGHCRGKSHGAVHELHDPVPVIQSSCWANLPPELLRDVIERLEASEATWPCRRNVVACAAVCKTWREMCKEIVKNPEECGKLTFPVSLKQPGPRHGIIQCFIKRDRSTQTYYLYLSLSSAVLVENGKFLLSAKRICRATWTEYIISMNANSISSSSNTYLGKMRSNVIGTKFIMYDTQPPYNSSTVSNSGKPSQRFYSKNGSTKVPCSLYSIAQVSYKLNVLGTRGPRRMHCVMHSIPASSLEAGGTVPCQMDSILARRSLDESFSRISISKSSIMDHSVHFSSARFSDSSIRGGPGISRQSLSDEDQCKDVPLILRNKAPR